MRGAEGEKKHKEVCKAGRKELRRVREKAREMEMGGEKAREMEMGREKAREMGREKAREMGREKAREMEMGREKAREMGRESHCCHPCQTDVGEDIGVPQELFPPCKLYFLEARLQLVFLN